VEAENYWLPASAWAASAGVPDFTDGERIVIGIDIGGERADSAVAWINENLHIGCEVLSGDRAVLEIADVVHELAEQFTIVECAFDPWRAGQIGASTARDQGVGLPAARRADDPGLTATL
jgi:phage terminase large subunit-like protein